MEQVRAAAARENIHVMRVSSSQDINTIDCITFISGTLHDFGP